MGVNTHCDERLDQLIGQHVRVKFYDGSWCEGILSKYTPKYGIVGYSRLFIKDGLLRYNKRSGIHLFNKTDAKDVIVYN